DAHLRPGESVTYRLVITFPSLYTLQSRYTGGPLAISRTGPDGTFAVDPGKPDFVNGTNDTYLTPGVYLVQLTATGTQPVTLKLDLKNPSSLIESILANGIG